MKAFVGKKVNLFHILYGNYWFMILFANTTQSVLCCVDTPFVWIYLPCTLEHGWLQDALSF